MGVGEYDIVLTLENKDAIKKVKEFDGELEDFAGKDKKRLAANEKWKKANASKTHKEQKKALKEMSTFLEQEHKARMKKFKGDLDKQSAEIKRHHSVVEKMTKAHAKRVSAINQKSRTGRAKEKVKGGFESGGVMGALKAVPGVAKIGAVVAGGLALATKALVDMGIEAAKVNNILDRTGNHLKLSADELAIYRDELLSIRRPADMSAEAIANIGFAVSNIPNVDKSNIAGITEQILNLQRLEPGASIDKIIGSVGRLGSAIGDNQKAMDSIAVLAGQFRGKVAEPLDEALTELAVVYSKASTVYEDQEKAMRDSAGLLSALVETGVEVSEATTQAEELMLKLNDIANDPKIRKGIFDAMPAGFENLKAKMADGKVGAIEFIQELEKMGDEGDKVAYAIGSTAGEGVQALLKSFKVGEKSIGEFAAKFDDVSGASQRMADEMVSPLQKAQESMKTSWDNAMLSIGSGTEGMVTSVFQSVAGMMDTIGGWFESPLVGFNRLKGEMTSFNETADQVAMLAGVVGQELATIGDVADMSGAEQLMIDIVAQLHEMENVSPIVREQIEALLASEAPVNARLLEMQNLLIGIETITRDSALFSSLEAAELAGEALNDTLEEATSGWLTFLAMGKGEQEILSLTFSNIPEDLADAKAEYDDLLKKTEGLNTDSQEYVDLMDEALEVRKEVADLTHKSESIQKSLNTMVENELGLLILSGDAEKDKAMALQSIISAQNESNVHLKNNQDYVDQVTKLIDQQYDSQLKITGAQKETNKLSLIQGTTSKDILENARETNDAAMDSAKLNDKNIKTYKNILSTLKDTDKVGRALYEGAIDSLEAENDKLDAVDEAITLKEAEIALQELELDLEDGLLEMLGQEFDWNAATNEQKIEALTLLQQEIDGDIVKVENIINGLQMQILLQDTRNELDNEAANLAAKYNAELNQSGVLVEQQRVGAADRVAQMQGMLADMKASSSALGTKIGTLTTAGAPVTKGGRVSAKKGRGVAKADKEAEEAAKKRAKLQEDLAKIQEDLNKKLIAIEEKRISDMRALAEKQKDLENDKLIDQIHSNADLKRSAKERARIERDINDRAIEFRKTLFDAVQGFIGGNLDQIQSVLAKFLSQSERLAKELSGISLETSEEMKEFQSNILNAEADLQKQQALLNAEGRELQSNQDTLDERTLKLQTIQAEILRRDKAAITLESARAKKQGEIDAANERAKVNATAAAIASALKVDKSQVKDVDKAEAEAALKEAIAQINIASKGKAQEDAGEKVTFDANKAEAAAAIAMQKIIPELEILGTIVKVAGKQIADFKNYPEMEAALTSVLGKVGMSGGDAGQSTMGITGQIADTTALDKNAEALLELARQEGIYIAKVSESTTFVRDNTTAVRDQKDSIGVLEQQIKDWSGASEDITDLDLTPLVRATIALDDINERLQRQSELFRQSRDAAESGDQVESLRLFAEASKLVTDQELMLIDTMGEFIAEGGKATVLTGQLTDKIGDLTAKLETDLDPKERLEIQERVKEFQNLHDTLVDDVIPAIGSLKDATILSETGAFMAEFDDAGAKSKAFADGLSEARKALLDFAPEAQAAIDALMAVEVDSGERVTNVEAVNEAYAAQTLKIDSNVKSLNMQLDNIKAIEAQRTSQGLDLTAEEKRERDDLNKSLEYSADLLEDMDKQHKKDIFKAMLKDTVVQMDMIDTGGKAVLSTFDLINGKSVDLKDNIFGAAQGMGDMLGKMTNLPFGQVVSGAKAMFDTFLEIGKVLDDMQGGYVTQVEFLEMAIRKVDILNEKEQIRLDIQQRRLEIMRAENDMAEEQLDINAKNAQESVDIIEAAFSGLSTTVTHSTGNFEAMSESQLMLLESLGLIMDTSVGAGRVFDETTQKYLSNADAMNLLAKSFNEASPEDLLDFYEGLSNEIQRQTELIDKNNNAINNQDHSQDYIDNLTEENELAQAKIDLLQTTQDEVDNLLTLTGLQDDLERQAIRDKMDASNFAYEMEKHNIMMTYEDEEERAKALADLEKRYADERIVNLKDLLATAQAHYDEGLISLKELQDIQLNLNSAELDRLELERAITDEMTEQTGASQEQLDAIREMHIARQEAILTGGDPEQIAKLQNDIIAKMKESGATPEAIQATMDSFAQDSFDTGTAYVPNDMLAKVHQGERIFTTSENAQMIEAMNRSANIMSNMPSMDSLARGVVDNYVQSSAALEARRFTGNSTGDLNIEGIVVNVTDSNASADDIAAAVVDAVEDLHEQWHDANGTGNGR